MTYNSFAFYGLNRNRNFLKCPTCEDKIPFIIDSKKEIEERCQELLAMHSCPDSAIFLVYQDGNMETIFKHHVYDDGIEFGMMDGCDMHFFSEMDGEYRYCCYGLIIEERPGEWMIQE